MLGVMKPRNKKWTEFLNRLEGPEGINVRENPKYPGDLKRLIYDCDASDLTCPHARAILVAMGATETEIINSILFFHAHGGFCDCEILMNVNYRRKGNPSIRSRKGGI